MNHRPSRSAAAGAAADGAALAEARELADHLAGQDPLDAAAAVWAARRQDGLSAPEEAELQAWLAGDPGRGARLDRLAGVLGQLDQLPPDDVAALRAAQASASAPSGPVPRSSAPAGTRDSAGTRTHAPRQPARRRWLAAGARWLPRAAMAGTVALLAGGGWMGWNHWQQQPTFVQNFVTQRGQQITATLPDGTRLQLDTATQLDVAVHRDRRVVRLRQGQALFDVKPDATRPFHVLAGATRITVVGTRFSVRLTARGLASAGVRVVVEEGRVQVARTAQPGGAMGPDTAVPAAEGEALALSAGQSAVADARGHWSAVTTSESTGATAWREGRIVLNDTPLRDAVDEFERYMDTGLVIDDPRVAALRLNGSFDLRQLDAFQRALPRALPVRLRSRSDGKTEVLAAD